MSSVESIFVCELNTQRRSPTQLNEVLRQVTPHTIQHSNIKYTDRGFFIDYPYEKCANFIFNANVVDIFTSHNLSAELAYKTANNRLIYCPGITTDIYNKSIPEITAEIVKVTNLRILKVTKFEGNYDNSRRYLAITADSRENRDLLVRNRSLRLFGKDFETHLPIPKNRSGV